MSNILNNDDFKIDGDIFSDSVNEVSNNKNLLGRAKNLIFSILQNTKHIAELNPERIADFGAAKDFFEKIMTVSVNTAIIASPSFRMKAVEIALKKFKQKENMNINNDTENTQSSSFKDIIKQAAANNNNEESFISNNTNNTNIKNLPIHKRLFQNQIYFTTSDVARLFGLNREKIIKRKQKAYLDKSELMPDVYKDVEFEKLRKIDERFKNGLSITAEEVTDEIKKLGKSGIVFSNILSLIAGIILSTVVLIVTKLLVKVIAASETLKKTVIYLIAILIYAYEHLFGFVKISGRHKVSYSSALKNKIDKEKVKILLSNINSIKIMLAAGFDIFVNLFLFTIFSVVITEAFRYYLISKYNWSLTDTVFLNLGYAIIAYVVKRNSKNILLADNKILTRDMIRKLDFIRTVKKPESLKNMFDVNYSVVFEDLLKNPVKLSEKTNTPIKTSNLIEKIIDSIKSIAVRFATQTLMNLISKYIKSIKSGVKTFVEILIYLFSDLFLLFTEFVIKIYVSIVHIA